LTRITQLIIGPECKSELVSMLRDKAKKIIYAYKGSELSIDEIRELPNSDRIAIVITEGEKINRYVSAALLKGLEEGKSNYIFFTSSIMKFNQALASRCQKTFLKNETDTTEENIWEDLDNAEIGIIKSVLGIGNINRTEIYRDKLDYKRIFTGISRAYANKAIFDNISREVWGRIESVIIKPDFRADRRALWYLMK